MPRSFLSLLCIWAVLCVGRGQTIVYVDPTFGPVNTNPPTFRTITDALNFLLNPALGIGPGNPGLVRCLPGVYSGATNNETFPIEMRAFIDIESVAGAPSTVIIGAQDQPYTGQSSVVGFPGVFLPIVGTGGVRSLNMEVLVSGILLDTGEVPDDDYLETFNGFTLRGGNIQFYIETESSRSGWTISNCVLDMINGADRFLPGGNQVVNGPTFGLLQVQVYDDALETDIRYPVINTNFINNTVVMGWAPRSATETGTLSIANAVGICDVSDPAIIYPGATPDPDVGVAPPFRGVGVPSIQNCIIRTLPNQPATTLPFLGIDATDCEVQIGTNPGPTNAFDTARAAVTTNGTFSSVRSTVNPATPLAPVPAIDINPSSGIGGRDPAFVGEYMSFGAPAQSLEAAMRDWRILPTSPYVDLGSSPIGTAVGIRLQAVNGTFYDRPLNPNLEIMADSFAWDGEGAGNPRISVDPTALGGTPGLSAEVDIGFDEAGPFVLGRSYGNDGRMHGLVRAINGQRYPVGVFDGQPIRELIFPQAGFFQMLHASEWLGTGTPGSGTINGGTIVGDWVQVGSWPSLAQPGTYTFTGGETGLDFSYFAPTLITAILQVNAIATPYVAPNEVSAQAHVFGSLLAPHLKAEAATWSFSWQSFWLPITANPSVYLTNAQSELY